MDKILIMLDLKDNSNTITVIEGNIIVADIYNREEIIEKLSDLIEFLTYDY